MVEQLSKLSQFMEKHLLLLLLGKPCNLQHKITVLASTKMLDALAEAHTELHGSVPDITKYPVLGNKDSILSELDELERKVKPLLNSKEDLLDTELHSLKAYAKLQYEVGDYEGCANVLEELRRANERDYWGEIMVSILLGRKEDAQHLIEEFQTNTNDLRDKAWILHLALFASFPESPAFFFEIANMTKFTNTIEVACPHLLRYLIAAALVKKPGKLVEIFLNNKILLKNDPALEAFDELFESYDVEKSIKLLEKFNDEVKKDHFLEGISDKLVSEAKSFLTFCQSKLCKKTQNA
ncbi:hypothetical protein SteCoe_23668 [Stentor coeruleus]|uniref:Uncharacterized protein n=1 Tax=Stentor coeruleus TaxID=5963 RepID=A0A1R2BJD9_9CILI|nr:hypothetical protein SteCoe_23668 [Stentor coeruleus]